MNPPVTTILQLFVKKLTAQKVWYLEWSANIHIYVSKNLTDKGLKIDYIRHLGEKNWKWGAANFLIKNLAIFDMIFKKKSLL